MYLIVQQPAKVLIRPRESCLSALKAVVMTKRGEKKVNFRLFENTASLGLQDLVVVDS